MKVCLVKNNQISKGIYTGINKPNVLIPKELVPESNIMEVSEVTYEDVLNHVNSELDLVYISNLNRNNLTLVTDDLKILSFDYGILSQITLDDDTINYLGYTTEIVRSSKGMKVAVPDVNSDLFKLNSLVYGTVNKKDMMTLLTELFNKEYINSIEFRAIYKEYDEEEDSYRAYYNLDNEKFKQLSESEFDDKRKKIEVSRIIFDKIFNREEANDILRIINKYVENVSIHIYKVRIDDVYTLV